MVRPDGFVKVLDFGLAHDFAGQLAATLQPSAAALPAGTLRYMSPEQLREEPITGASDVFSLGIVLYELAAGRHPFESEYVWETAYAIHTRDPAAPSAVNRDVPAWLDELILSMLERDSGLRPSAEQVESSLLRSSGGIRSRGRHWRAFRGRLFPSNARRATWALPVLALVALWFLPPGAGRGS
jgi:eukaryotic-like serine/threonine-protein kinase